MNNSTPRTEAVERFLEALKNGDYDFITNKSEIVLLSREEYRKLTDDHNLLRRTQEIAEIGSWIYDIKSDYLSWSEEVYSIFGYRHNEFGNTSEAFFATIHPEDLEKVQIAYSSSLAEGKLQYEVEHRIIRKDNGEVRFVFERCTHETNHDGEIVRSIGIVQDITKHKILEQKTSRSKELFQQIVEKSRDIFYRQNIKTGRFEYISPKIEDILGISVEEALNLSVEEQFKAFHPADLPNVLHFVEELIEADTKGTKYIEREFRLADKFGTYRWLHGTYSLLRDENGEPKLIVGNLQDISEKRLVSEELELRQQKYESLFNNINIAVALHEIIIDDDNKPVDFLFINVNPKYEEMNQLKSEDIIGKRGSDLFPNMDHNWIDKMGKVALTGESLNEIYHAKKIDKYYDLKAYSPGKKQFAIAISDVTDRVKTESALRESEERFRKIYEHMETGVAQVGLDFRIKSANNAYCRMLGYTEEELIGKTLQDITHPEIIQENMEKQRALREGKIDHYRLEKSFIHKLGHTVYGIMDANLIRDNNGNPLYFMGSVTDITDWKIAEKSLVDSEKKYRSMFDHAGVLISAYDKDGKCILMNEIVAGLFLGSPEDFIGKSIVDLHSPDGNQYLQNITDVIKGEKTRTHENNVTFPAGKRWLLTTIFPLRDIKGQVYAAQLVSQDFTELKLAEMEKDRLQEQLTHAQKMESVGRLAGGVAHDFNNMLGSILGNVDLALMELNSDDPLYDYLKEIETAATRSAELTRQLLGFARKQTVLPKTLNLNDVVTGMLKMLERLIGENITLEWKPDHELWSIIMDPVQIDQILANLIVNARDAIEGIGTVAIETKNTRLTENSTLQIADLIPGNYVQLLVEDNGCGMDEHLVANIFDPFFTTKPVGEGTGLGLSTVYGIVKQNGGYITVDSAPGKGTTFSIYLPRHDGKTEKIIPDRGEQTTATGEETILLVEDEPTILRVGEKMLKSFGYHVLTADCPSEALRIAETYPSKIHLLITDVMMPEMNGPDLADKLETIHPEIKMLFMSGYTSDIVSKDNFLNNSANFIQKPYTIKALSEKVQSILLD